MAGLEISKSGDTDNCTLCSTTGYGFMDREMPTQVLNLTKNDDTVFHMRWCSAVGSRLCCNCSKFLNISRKFTPYMYINMAKYYKV